MKRWSARLTAVTSMTAAVLGVTGVTAALAETPTSCAGKYVCLQDGTVFGGPAESYPATAGDQNVTAQQIAEDCARDRMADIPGVACGFYAYGDPTTPEGGWGPWAPITGDFNNCRGDAPGNIGYDDRRDYTTTSSVTVGAGLEIGLSDIVKASLSVSYQQTWGTATGSTQRYSAHVPLGYRAHLQRRIRQQEVAGVLWIDYEHTGTGQYEGHGHHYWAITDFTSTSPVKNTANANMVDDQVSLSEPQPLQPGDC